MWNFKSPLESPFSFILSITRQNKCHQRNALRRPAWVPLLLRLLLAGIAACDASPADDSAGPGGRGPRGRARGDAGADEAVPRHDSSYGTFASEFYDLRYLSEEGEATRG